MALDLEKLEKEMDDLIDNTTQEELDKYFPPDLRPTGWISIEDDLPMWLAIDFLQGYSIFKVKNDKGEEFESAVSDHNTWYYAAKEQGITHWWHE